jgi:mycothiol synthase
VPEPSVAEVTPARFGEVEARVARIDHDVRAVDGHGALGDAVWLDLEHPGTDSAGFLIGDRAYAHVARSDNAIADQWSLGLSVAPDARRDGTRRALVTAAVRHVAGHGGGRIVLWVLGATADDETDLTAAGLQPVRELYEMRVVLPLGVPPRWPEGVGVRRFEVGADEAEWLGVNNRAFAGHAEQGGWTAQTLARRMAEAWFDPELFLLAFDADGVVGFNWLKVHDATDRDPRLGEIYVIGVDDRAQGTGLGRALAIAGLDALHARGIDTGMLFCAAGNVPALKLYESLGFVVHRVDRAYECEVGECEVGESEVAKS